MLTTTEIAVTATIWLLTITGGFFGVRSAFRKVKTMNTQNRDMSIPVKEVAHGQHTETNS